MPREDIGLGCGQSQEPVDDLDEGVRGLRPVTVPQDIGINVAEGYLTSLHTHDASGIIHIESPTSRTFTLGEVFDVWGVRFSTTCLGGYCNGGSRRVWVFMNGRQVTSDPRRIQLAAHQEIVVAYGTSRELPSPIPSSYSFPTGL